MQLLVYLLAYPILWVVSRLPWPLFYLFSDGVYVMTYYVVRYRFGVVTRHLEQAFPDKSKQEIQHIRKAFYKHMCDMFLEMIKSMSISEKDIQKRFELTNMETLRAMENKGKSALVMYAHYASYEWSNSINLSSTLQCIGIYKKVRNPYFNALLIRIRARFDSPLIESKQVLRRIIKDKAENRLRLYGMISDQTPKIQNSFYWRPFMGVTVPTFMGAELLAKKLDLPVYYMKVSKKKRGFYQAEIVPITLEPKKCKAHYITDTYTQLLEAQIKQQPQYYLWTHKRWKLKDAIKPEGAVVHTE